MKVAFVFLHPFDGSLGSTVRVRELAISLHKFGVESYILTPYESSYRLTEGVNVVSIGGYMKKFGLANYLYKASKLAYYNPFFVRHLMLNRKLQAYFAKSLAAIIQKTIEKIGVDIIQFEQDVALSAAVELKKKTGLPIIVDIHNILSEELVGAGVIRRDSNEFFGLQKAQAENLKHVNSVVVVSEMMKKYVSETYTLRSEQIFVVPPGAQLQKTSLKKTVTAPRIVYSGLVSYREHLDLFVNCMPIVRERFKNAEFYITKKGNALNKIERLAKKVGVNPTFFWYSNKEDFFEFLSSCHVGVLPSSNDLARQMGTPVKLFDYLSVGLPVVANDVNAWTQIISDESVGIVTADDPKSFADAIIKLLENQQLREQYSCNAINSVADRYSWGNSANRLMQLFTKYKP
ncbi:MAG: glycosyltransferase [Candidatus Bathyarchaeia archaeon]